jgi:hypothetical protein
MIRRIIFLVSIVLCVVCSSQVRSAAAQPRSSQQSGEALVTLYYQIFNAGLRNGDFSAMASVFAPDATLSHSSAQGETSTFQGLNAIIAFYHRVYLNIPGTQFKRDKLYDLSPTILLNYEHGVGTGLRLPPRCSHLFDIRNGRLHQVFWVVYFNGAR